MNTPSRQTLQSVLARLAVASPVQERPPARPRPPSRLPVTVLRPVASRGAGSPHSQAPPAVAAAAAPLSPQQQPVGGFPAAATGRLPAVAVNAGAARIALVCAALVGVLVVAWVVSARTAAADAARDHDPRDDVQARMSAELRRLRGARV